MSNCKTKSAIMLQFSFLSDDCSIINTIIIVIIIKIAIISNKIEIKIALSGCFLSACLFIYYLRKTELSSSTKNLFGSKFAQLAWKKHVNESNHRLYFWLKQIFQYVNMLDLETDSRSLHNWIVFKSNVTEDHSCLRCHVFRTFVDCVSN